MTVRIAQDLGIKKIVNFSKELGIYEDPHNYCLYLLGSAETTLLKLTPLLIQLLLMEEN